MIEKLETCGIATPKLCLYFISGGDLSVLLMAHIPKNKWGYGRNVLSTPMRKCRANGNLRDLMLDLVSQ